MTLGTVARALGTGLNRVSNSGVKELLHQLSTQKEACTRLVTVQYHLFAWRRSWGSKDMVTDRSREEEGQAKGKR